MLLWHYSYPDYFAKELVPLKGVLARVPARGIIKKTGSLSVFRAYLKWE